MTDGEKIIQDVRNSFLRAFPVGSAQGLTSASGSTAGAANVTSPSSARSVVRQTLEGVLGRSFKTGDTRSFKAALESSFEQKQIGATPSYEWKPRAYPSVGATDIGGGVSGAQFSLVKFATSLHEQTQPLINDLHSLDPKVDREEFDAARAIFSATWDEFVNELSREGGPRVLRADSLAKSIFGLGDDGTEGHLVSLGVALLVIDEEDDDSVLAAAAGSLVGKINVNRRNIVTSEEEGYLTNFIALRDYYFAVAQAWENYRDQFAGKDLGTGLLLLERALSVVETGVNDVYFGLDLAGITQSERLVITIDPDPEQGLTVEDLLSWIASFASSEAPQLIREGGRLGVEAIIPTAQTLATLTEAFKDQMEADGDPPPLPPQFRLPHVLDPVNELVGYLNTLVQRAENLKGGA